MEILRKIILNTIKEPSNKMSKEPNMPTRVQAKKAHRHQPQAKAPHKKASTQMPRESRNPKPPSPRQNPIHLDWRLPPPPPQVMKAPANPRPSQLRKTSLGNPDTEPTPTSLPLHPCQHNDPPNALLMGLTATQNGILSRVPHTSAKRVNQ